MSSYPVGKAVAVGEAVGAVGEAVGETVVGEAIRAENIIAEKIAESVTTTAVLEQILGIAIVAMVLTVLEVFSIIYIVFPKIKNKIDDLIESQSVSSQTTSIVKPLIETLAKREKIYTARANDYIVGVAYIFIAMLFVICIVLVFLIDNEYRLRGNSRPSGLYRGVFFWAAVTIFGIAVFQGFGCIIFGVDSSFCSSDSFAIVSSEWKQNNDFAQIALQTGICDNIGDVNSFSDNDTDLRNMITSAIGKDLIANTISEDTDKDMIADIIGEIEQKRSTGVMRRSVL